MLSSAGCSWLLTAAHSLLILSYSSYQFVAVGVGFLAKHSTSKDLLGLHRCHDKEEPVDVRHVRHCLHETWTHQQSRPLAERQGGRCSKQHALGESRAKCGNRRHPLLRTFKEQGYVQGTSRCIYITKMSTKANAPIRQHMFGLCYCIRPNSPLNSAQPPNQTAPTWKCQLAASTENFVFRLRTPTARNSSLADISVYQCVSVRVRVRVPRYSTRRNAFGRATQWNTAMCPKSCSQLQGNEQDSASVVQGR